MSIVQNESNHELNFVQHTRSDFSKNLFLKFAILAAVCIQTTSHILVSKYSSSILHEEYSRTELVLVSETIKLIICVILVLHENSKSDVKGFTVLLNLLLYSKKIIILVVLYSVCNLLAYYAIARCEAAAYAVLLQLKILTTAGFSVLILGKEVSALKWRTLMQLVMGCILVVSPSFTQKCVCPGAGGTRSTSEAEGSDDEFFLSVEEQLLGIAAVLTQVLLSGFSSNYFEAMLKSDSTSVWARNFQLAFYSVLTMLALVFIENMYKEGNMVDSGTTMGYVPFRGWTPSAFALAIISSGGGLLVAATLKYADSILKSLAVSASIVLSSLLGWLMLEGIMDIIVAIGGILTILCIINYTFDPSDSAAASKFSSPRRAFNDKL